MLRAFSSCDTKLLMRSSRLILLLLFLLLPLYSQVDEENLDINILSPDTYSLDWDGKNGRTYFIQCAEDIENWVFEPVIRSGEGTELNQPITSNAFKMFFRLVATDQDDGGDPETADFDGDGISNLEEITNTLQTSPLNEDTDGDTLSDGWEVAYGFDPTNSDEDNNGVLDGQDEPNEYINAIENFQDPNYILLPIEGSFSDDTIGNVTLLNDGGVAYYNSTQKKIYYWYEGNLITENHDGTEFIYFINTGYGISYYLEDYYYKLSGGTIEKVSVAPVSDVALKAHVTSLFRAGYYSDESEYIIDSIELSEYSSSYKHSNCLHIFSDGGGVYYSQDRYKVTYHRASSTNGNQSTRSYTPKIYFYRKGTVEEYNPIYTDKKNTYIRLDGVGGRATAPVIALNYDDHNGNDVTSLFNAIDHSLLEYDSDFYSSSKISSQGHLLYSDQKVHNFNDDTFTGKEESGGGITTWYINNRGDVLDSQTIGRRFHDPETNRTAWVHKRINVLNVLDPYLLTPNTYDLGDIPMQGESEVNTLESPLPLIAGEVFDRDDTTPDGVGVLIPVEVAPEVLAVNSDFDEGRIDPTTGYALPDCDDDDIALEAVRGHLDGNFSQYERITDDMHEGWFGIHPHLMDDSFWDGATVTIRKIDKLDYGTGYKESGQVRFYAKWGDDAGQYRAIVPYDMDTLDPSNLTQGGINVGSNDSGVGESVYGSDSAFPVNTKFYIEGVRSGDITLEWRYQKGSIDIKYDQTFVVATQQSPEEWKDSLAYKIKLETSNDPSGIQDISIKPTSSMGYWERMERLSECYDYYQECFVEDQAFLWSGLARLAANQVVAGVSDMEYGKDLTYLAHLSPAGFIPGLHVNNQLSAIQQNLFNGGYKIFNSIGWQHHAYRSSGIKAMSHLLDKYEDNIDVRETNSSWEQLDLGKNSGFSSFYYNAGYLMADYEQNTIVVPTFENLAELSLAWRDADDLFSSMSVNPCKPDGLDFADALTSVPNASIANTTHRWTWIDFNQTPNGILGTWAGLWESHRLELVEKYSREDCKRFAKMSALNLPVKVNDHLDVK